MYKPTSKFLAEKEKEKERAPAPAPPEPVTKKPVVSGVLVCSSKAVDARGCGSYCLQCFALASVFCVVDLFHSSPFWFGLISATEEERGGEEEKHVGAV